MYEEKRRWLLGLRGARYPIASIEVSFEVKGDGEPPLTHPVHGSCVGHGVHLKMFFDYGK